MTSRQYITAGDGVSEGLGPLPAQGPSVPGDTTVRSAAYPDAPMFPRDHATDAHFCPKCGEPEVDPSVEAFEIFGEAMCADCAADLFDTTPQEDAQ